MNRRKVILLIPFSFKSCFYGNQEGRLDHRMGKEGGIGEEGGEEGEGEEGREGGHSNTLDCTKLEHLRAKMESVSCSCSSLQMPILMMWIGSSGSWSCVVCVEERGGGITQEGRGGGIRQEGKGRRHKAGGEGGEA